MKSIIRKTISILIVILTMISISMSAYAVDVDYMDKHGEKGKELWESYLDALTPVKEGKYPELLDLYVYLSDNYMRYYNNLTKRDEQDFLDMSDYEQLLWDTSVLIMDYEGASYKNYDQWRAIYSLATQEFNTYIKDKDESLEIRKAYIALMDWSYYYYESTGGFYNFIEDKDSFDYINDYYDTDTSSKEKETSKDIEENNSRNSESVETNSSEITVVSDISSSAASFKSADEEIKGSHTGVVVVVIVILVIAAIVFVVIQKKKTKE